MYRILDANAEVKERRDQLRHPTYTRPELIAVRPNDVWSWDITKLRTHVKFEYLYLYVILDIFSRYVVGWLLAEHENAQLAERLIKETCDKHGATPGYLHADRGRGGLTRRLRLGDRRRVPVHVHADLSARSQRHGRRDAPRAVQPSDPWAGRL